MVILILTNKWDITSDFVISILKKKNIQFIRINTEDLIKKNTTVCFPDFSYYIENNLNIENFSNNVKSILLRRPGKPFEFTSKEKMPSDSVIRYITDQWHAFISGLESIPNILWINNPQKNSFAEVKINQLHLANELGFKIPKTCITSSKHELEKFWSECDGKIIAKSLFSPLIKEDKNEYFIFSNRLSSMSDISKDELSISPTIFQEEVQKKTDLRVTVVGTNCFTVKIDSNEPKVLDWRTIESGIEYSKTDIPPDVQEKCLKMVSRLGLTFGAIDIVRSNDDYFFLEINPNGEWGWLQKNTKMPIAETLVEELLRRG